MPRAKYEEALWDRVIRRNVRNQQSIASPSETYQSFYDFLKWVSAQRELNRPTLEDRVETLEKQVQQLMHKNTETEKPSKVDAIYKMFKDELEKTCMGKIVAIDIGSKKIVGIGSTIIEAYKDARKNSEKQKFSYKRVGSPYVYRLR
jgi:hypothetical protein